MLRHAAADKAVATAVGEGLFVAAAAVDFVYYTYGDTIEELRDHVAANWRSTRISDEIVARTRRVLERASGQARPRVIDTSGSRRCAAPPARHLLWPEP